MKYLVTACNEIDKVVLGTVDPSENELRRIFALACNTLKQLANDPAFLKPSISLLDDGPLIPNRSRP
jgi:hypothetical protein